ncbi:hypothetical protein [Neobacillus niacini]|uniref:hypothetical protein n=1 Tax=Neobacillus niacini TaxID=86668 RepID=UPI002FFF2657
MGSFTKRDFPTTNQTFVERGISRKECKVHPILDYGDGFLSGGIRRKIKVDPYLAMEAAITRYHENHPGG